MQLYYVFPLSVSTCALQLVHLGYANMIVFFTVYNFYKLNIFIFHQRLVTGYLIYYVYNIQVSLNSYCKYHKSLLGFSSSFKSNKFTYLSIAVVVDNIKNKKIFFEDNFPILV